METKLSFGSTLSLLLEDASTGALAAAFLEGFEIGSVAPAGAARRVFSLIAAATGGAPAVLNVRGRF
jgi:hypothetical protein